MSSPHSNRTFLQQEWQAFWLALGFLTRLPMLVTIDYSPALMNRSSVWFPLVGLILGSFYSLAFIALQPLTGDLVAVIVVLCGHLWITGAFHEDGLADSADALGGGYTVADRLRIMKDSRIGTYGAAVLIMALLLKTALLVQISHTALALLITPCAARLSPLVLMNRMRYVTDPDNSRSKPVASALTNQRLWVATVMVMVPALALQVWWPGLWWQTILSVGVVCLLWGNSLRKALGGYTGDTLGASVIFSELALLLLMLILEPKVMA